MPRLTAQTEQWALGAQPGLACGLAVKRGARHASRNRNLFSTWKRNLLPHDKATVLPAGCCHIDSADSAQLTVTTAFWAVPPSPELLLREASPCTLFPGPRGRVDAHVPCTGWQRAARPGQSPAERSPGSGTYPKIPVSQLQTRVQHLHKGPQHCARWRSSPGGRHQAGSSLRIPPAAPHKEANIKGCFADVPRAQHPSEAGTFTSKTHGNVPSFSKSQDPFCPRALPLVPSQPCLSLLSSATGNTRS